MRAERHATSDVGDPQHDIRRTVNAGSGRNSRIYDEYRAALRQATMSHPAALLGSFRVRHTDDCVMPLARRQRSRSARTILPVRFTFRKRRFLMIADAETASGRLSPGMIDSMDRQNSAYQSEVKGHSGAHRARCLDGSTLFSTACIFVHRA